MVDVTSTIRELTTTEGRIMRSDMSAIIFAKARTSSRYQKRPPSSAPVE